MRAPTIGLIRLRRQQILVPQSLDQARQLRLVTPGMIHQIAQRRSGITGEETQHPEFHVRDLMQAVPQLLILPGAVEVHDRMDGLEHIVGHAIVLLVDFINLFSHNGGYYQLKDQAMKDISPARQIQRVRHEIRQRDVEIVRTEALGPNFISITFQDDSLDGFVSESFDDHVKFMFNDPTGELLRRDYTPRHFDRNKRELTIEFALHDHGKASEWAQHAKAGQRAVIAGPRGSMIIPMDYPWHLLVGDATALPAIHRRLEELPEGVRATVIVQIDDAADQRSFRSKAGLDVHWVYTAAELLSTLRAVQPQSDGYAWCAGEGTTMVKVREILLTESGLAKERMRVAAYWKHGAPDFHERLEG